jgi:hypothetical protein
MRVQVTLAGPERELQGLIQSQAFKSSGFAVVARNAADRDREDVSGGSGTASAAPDLDAPVEELERAIVMLAEKARQVATAAEQRGSRIDGALRRIDDVLAQMAAE